jgi:primosomal protein N'
MNYGRRGFLAKVTGATAAVFMALIGRAPARACLAGTWYVKCPKCGKIDKVDGGTCQHKCERCNYQSFTGTDVTVVCPKGHAHRIKTGACERSTCTKSYICPICKQECRR